jgi:hypothetical protein
VVPTGKLDRGSQQITHEFPSSSLSIMIILTPYIIFTSETDEEGEGKGESSV